MLLAEAEQLANIGSWELEFEGPRTLYWSAHFYRLLGLKPRKAPHDAQLGPEI